MLRHSTLRAFNTAVAQLYQPDLTITTYEQKCYEFLDALLPSEFIVFGSLDVPTENLSLDINTPVTEFQPAMESFARLMSQYKLFCWDPTVNNGKPFYMEDFYTRRQFRELDMYSEVFKKIGVDNHCAIHISGHPDEIAFIGVERLGGSGFTDEEKLLVELSQLHLSNARKLAISISDSYQAKVLPDTLVCAGLTPREAEVLMWLAEGKANDEIAALLSISLYTIKDHLKMIFQKIGVHNRLEAALWAIRQSLAGTHKGSPERHTIVRAQRQAPL